MENEYTMTAADVAKLFGVTVETVRHWRQARGFPFVMLTARNVRFSRREVLEWQNRQRPGMQATPSSSASSSVPVSAGGAE